MTSSTADASAIAATSLEIGDDALTVELADGRVVSAPLVWYPRLEHATAQERANWRWIGAGSGTHWPDLDEDVSIENPLAGKPSAESQRSLQRWLAARNRSSH